jgi:hypothetical protein
MTTTSSTESVVAIYQTHLAAEGALKAVQQAGVDMRHLSIVAKGFNSEQHALGFYTSGDRMKYWGGRGVLWGALWGTLFGSALFVLPAVGPLVVMGPLVGWMASALEGAVVGGATGILAAGLASIGIPKDSIVKYELEVKAGRYLVLAHGDAALLERVRALLTAAGAAQVSSHGGVTEAREPLAPPVAAASADGRRAPLVTREAILNLLSDDETARVSNAEWVAALPDGEEYLDLERLDEGVRRHPQQVTSKGHLLPRRAVHEATWARILDRLAVPAVGAGASP